MIVGWKPILFTLPTAILFLFISYLVGELLTRSLRLLRRKPISFGSGASAIFWKSVTGIFFITATYACIITGLKTSLLPVPFFSVLILAATGKAPMPGEVGEHPRTGLVFFLLAAVLVYWTFFALHLLIHNNDITGYIGGDTLFYIWASDHLNAIGTENVTPAFDPAIQNLVEPYHYGDLWITALVQKITGIQPALVLPLVIYPIFISLFCLGLYAYLFPVTSKNYKWPARLTIFGGLVSGFAFLFPELAFSQSVSLAIPVADAPKLSYTALLVIGLMLALRNNAWELAFILAVTGTLLFVNSGPPILATLTVLFLFYKLKKSPAVRVNWLWMVVVISGLAYYYLFYQVYPSFRPVPGGSAFSTRTALNILGSLFFQSIPLVPFIIAGMVLFNKKQQLFPNLVRSPELFLLCLLPLTGILCWSILHPTSGEAVQFFYTVFIPASAIFIFYTWRRSLELPSAILKKICLGLLIAGIALNLEPIRDFQKVPTHDKNQVLAFVEKYGEGAFSNFHSKDETNSMIQEGISFTHPLYFLNYHVPSYYSISLNAPLRNIDSSSFYHRYEQQLLDFSPFSQFIKKSDSTLPIEDYMYLFITNSGIKYLALSVDTTLPLKIQPLAKDSIRLRNNWQLYYLEK